MGSAWLWYDEMFHMRAAVKPDLPWDRRDLALWMELMTLDTPVSGAWAESNHVLTVAQGLMLTPQKAMAHDPHPPPPMPGMLGVQYTRQVFSFTM